MKKHPDAKLTLRAAYEKHYDTSDLKPSTFRGNRHHLNRWERLTDDPPAGSITNETMARFRQTAIDAGLAPHSINSSWYFLRALFRRIGPPFTGNPQGLSIITAVPYMKVVKVPYVIPPAIPLEDISRVYLAARHARMRRTVLDAAAMFRCLIVLAYTSGLRKGDLWGLTWEAIDLDAGTFQFCASKTGKGAVNWPLHPVAVAHLRRIQRPEGGRVFRGLLSGGSGNFSKRWRMILEKSGLPRDRWFTLQDLRATHASEIEYVRQGLGWFSTQHAPRGTFERYYLNPLESLREAIESMRLPAGFRAGPKVAAKRDEEDRQKRLAMRHDHFVGPRPKPADWEFSPTAFRYRGSRWHQLRSHARLSALRLLAKAPGPITLESLSRRLGGTEKRARRAISHLRCQLRGWFGLADTFDPIPCIYQGKGLTSYVLAVPDEFS